MKNWETYLSRQHDEYLRPALAPEFAAGMVVVIPCYDEKELLTTLENLHDCEHPETDTIVLVVINSSVRSPEEAVLQNRETYQQVQKFSLTFSTGRLFFTAVIFENLPRKHAGVGLARKIGMDMAVDYFRKTNNPEGILVSLDADCTVSPNYLKRIYETFALYPKIGCTIHNFHHRAENDDPEIEKAVRQYENYIRYVEGALEFIGFPYYYHTIGSAFAVTADAYVRVGGMGRQQGGEDFYFLQKIFAQEKVAALDDVFVYPMARFSERVPFGTGPALQKIIAEPGGEMNVYSMNAFIALKAFFDMKHLFFKQDESVIGKHLTQLHPSLQVFIAANDVVKDITDCNNNSATPESFTKRFFHHFDAFRIIKFLNFAHPAYFQPQPVSVSLHKYREYVGI